MLIALKFVQVEFVLVETVLVGDPLYVPPSIRSYLSLKSALIVFHNQE